MGNVNQNRIDTVIDPADMTTIDGAKTTMETTLDPYTKSLTDDERSSLFGLNDENLVFTHLAHTHAVNLQAKFPPAIQAIIPRLGNDLGMFDQLDQIESTFVNQLAQRVSDT